MRSIQEVLNELDRLQVSKEEVLKHLFGAEMSYEYCGDYLVSRKQTGIPERRNRIDDVMSVNVIVPAKNGRVDIDYYRYIDDRWAFADEDKDYEIWYDVGSEV